MEALLRFGAGEYAASHDKLNSFEGHMAKAIVPSKEFLFGFGEIEVVGGYLGNHGI